MYTRTRCERGCAAKPTDGLLDFDPLPHRSRALAVYQLCCAVLCARSLPRARARIKRVCAYTRSRGGRRRIHARTASSSCRETTRPRHVQRGTRGFARFLRGGSAPKSAGFGLWARTRPELRLSRECEWSRSVFIDLWKNQLAIIEYEVFLSVCTETMFVLSFVASWLLCTATTCDMLSLLKLLYSSSYSSYDMK